MKIPLVDLRAQYASIKAEIDQAIQRVVESGRFILGEEVQAFEEEFAAFCNAQYAVGVASGTAALHLALLACGVGPGDEVITTPFTFIATAEAINYTGAKPVFVDIDPQTHNINPRHLEAAITERTRAIIPVHLYGYPADMAPIMEIAQRHDLWVIEDAAQAHGAEYKGQRVGTIGHLSCFSFYPAKNLGAYGDAGAVVTNDATLAEKVRLLRDHGRQEKYVHLMRGFAYRLDALQAAILRVKLRHLEEWNRRRRERAYLYRELLSDIPLKMMPPEETAGTRSVYHMFVVRTSRREEVRAHLRSQGIETGVHYPLPLHLQPAYRDLGYHKGDLPASEEAAREVLSLPMYPELTREQMEQVARALQSFWRGV